MPELNKPIHLIPIGDVHRFASLCDVEKWKDFLKKTKTEKNCYFLGMGDYLDLASTRERKVLGSTELHDFTFQTLDKLYLQQSDEFLKEISFMQGRLIGLLEGNHHGVFSDSNFTTTQYMCQQLKCKYLGVSAFIRLSFICKGRHAAVDLWVHHGKGASRLVGGSLNTVQQMADSADADIYLMGHDHKKSIAFKSRLQLTGNKGLNLANKKILLGRTGSFLKGYVPEAPSYVAKAALSPTDLGTIKIDLTPKLCGKRYDCFYIDIHASL